MVALARVGEFDLLLPADAESDVTACARAAATSRCSRSPTTAAPTGPARAARRAAARVAVIEVGRANTYGHPTPSTLAALRARVPHVLRTDRDGTVRLRVAGGRCGCRRDERRAA